ncbi:MAG: hypothetical protein DHS20C19_15530 [Acidimicrobiales bacterium]|nr:MAG: hypothetical protein DHS20C19_15530 [Acidimicrobiales bacterium]
MHMSAHVAVIVLVVEYTLTIVSSTHGVPSGARSPAQMSTTGRPWWVMQAEAPNSVAFAKFAANAVATGSHPGSIVPLISNPSTFMVLHSPADPGTVPRTSPVR